MHPRAYKLETVIAIMAVAAAFISYKLLAKHVTGSSGSAWFDAGCRDEAADGGPNCAAVLSSPYAYWPPKQENEPRGKGHLPVAFIGLVYYSVIAVWVLGIGRPARSRRWLHVFPLLFVVIGLFCSVQFVRIMFTEMDQWCPWCLATHILNLLIAVGIVLLWPRRLPDVFPDAQEPAGAAIGGEKHAVPDNGARAATSDRPPVGAGSPVVSPSWKRVLATVGLMVLVFYGDFGQFALLRAKQTGQLLNRCMGEVALIRGNADRLMRHWASVTPEEITVRPDDPFRTGADKDETVLEVVVFSDFLCPSCARFDTFFENKAQPLFDGRLKLIYKHYPLDTECNPQVMRTVHPGSCEAARIAEAARILGGRAAFWKAHDRLFELQREGHKGRKYDLKEFSSLIGVPIRKLVETLDLPEVRSRIEEDAVLAKTCGLRGTPAVFIQHKLIHPLATTSLGFWDKLADQFWEQTGTPRPPRTLPKGLTGPAKKAGATPDNPGRKGAP